MRDYQRLEIWRRSHALAIAIHGAARRMRGNEFATLRSQLTRAVDSVPANIVEGCSADSAREFARFLDISIKSASETEHHLLNARDRCIRAKLRAQSSKTQSSELRVPIWELEANPRSYQKRYRR